MKNRVLVQGRVTSVEHHRAEGSRGWDEFTYEFEYDGMRFVGSSKADTGTLWETTPDVGAEIEIYFYRDTQKWVIKRKLAVAGRDEYGNKVAIPKLIWVSLVFVFVGMLVATVSNKVGFFICGIAIVMVGVSQIMEEVKFIIDKSNGKYEVLHAMVVDYREYHRSRVNGHGRTTYTRKVYEYTEDGENRRYVSQNDGKKVSLGTEAFLYKKISTQEIREEADLAGGMVWFIPWGIIGAFMIYISIIA